jgi:hypothetical protein
MDMDQVLDLVMDPDLALAFLSHLVTDHLVPHKAIILLIYLMDLKVIVVLTALLPKVKSFFLFSKLI